MQVTVKKFDKTTHSGKCLVGFLIHYEAEAFVIEKKVNLVDGKTTEAYVAEAYALCTDQIDEWKEDVDSWSKEFDPATGTFVSPS
jgi:hypothetical protein